MNRIDCILELEREVEMHSRQLSKASTKAARSEIKKSISNARFRAAELIEAEIQAGGTHRGVANDLGYTKHHVRLMVRALKISCEQTGKARLPFDACYEEAKGSTAPERAVKAKALAEEGLSTRQVANRLGVDERTVRNYLDRSSQVKYADPEDCSFDMFEMCFQHLKEGANLVLNNREIRENPEKYEQALKYVEGWFLPRLRTLGEKNHNG